MTTTFTDQFPRALATCPPWCDAPKGHPYELAEETEGTESRFHTHQMMAANEVIIEVTALGRTPRNGAPEIVSEPVIGVYIAGNRDVYIEELSISRAIVWPGSSARACGTLLSGSKRSDERFDGVA